MEPHIRLQNWLKAAGITQAELARRCDYDRSNMHRVLSGALRPSLSLAVKLEEITGSAIVASAWVSERAHQ